MSCLFGHKFNKWVIKSRFEIGSEHNNTLYKIILIQERKCLKCDFIELNSQKVRF